MIFERPDEPTPFDACGDYDELFLVVHRLEGLEAVDKLLASSGAYREHLREAAAKLDAVGMKPLASLIRKHARKAKPNPYSWQARQAKRQRCI